MAWALLSAALCTAVTFVIEVSLADTGILQKVAFGACGLALIFGAVGHLVAHLGYVQRLASQRSKESQVSPRPSQNPEIGFLVPSLREEPEFIYRALLSCALQTHPKAWIRLLVDDPVNPEELQHRKLQAAALAMPGKVLRFLAPFESDVARLAGETSPEVLPGALIDAHERLASRFTAVANGWPQISHEDRLFCRLVLRDRAHAHAARAEALLRYPISRDEMRAEAKALLGRFTRDIDVFQRKQFVNLSHAPNKAMNLNAFIDLMGRRVAAEETPDGLQLRDCANGGTLIPDAPFLVTLDADSELHPEYAERLLGVMLSPESERCAVVQTPYSAVPDAPGLLEKVAGATTDVQRILHQGYFHFGAAFWVGANAMLRKRALEDIKETDLERGYRVARFIQDRTVIEDTESTIDLAAKDWSIHNHLEILAYSATPPDFGSLTIQRRRWACGGLLIFPKSIRLLLAEKGPVLRRIAAAVIRTNYLTSLAVVPGALVLMAFLPFAGALSTLSLPAAALPYFLGYAFDLQLAGRKAGSLPQVYGLNLILIPVNLAGASISVIQGLTGARPPFQKTPKVEGRTQSPSRILNCLWLGAIATLAMSITRAWIGDYQMSMVLLVNAMALLLSLAAFVGIEESFEDMGITRKPEVSVTLPPQMVNAALLPPISLPQLAARSRLGKPGLVAAEDKFAPSGRRMLRWRKQAIDREESQREV